MGGLGALHEAGLVGASLSASDPSPSADGVESGAGERLQKLKERALAPQSPARRHRHLRHLLQPKMRTRPPLLLLQQPIPKQTPPLSKRPSPPVLLQEEWPAFRAEPAAYAPYAPTSSYAHAIPTLPDFVRVDSTWAPLRTLLLGSTAQSPADGRGVRPRLRRLRRGALHEAGLVGTSLDGSSASVNGVEGPSSVVGGADPATIQATLAAGLAALQGEWAAFRAETAVYAPSTPMSVYAVPTIPDFARGRDMRSLGCVHGRGWCTRTTPPLTPRTSPKSEEDEDAGADIEGLQVPQHARQGTPDSEDARVPGLLTPEGSVRGARVDGRLRRGLGVDAHSCVEAVQG
ncbi:hypothetical protein DFH06DRAFT_1346672 [Mycena polygramma]|nr:hypothetical protein DFH06DRAFT_1346672 [Mycena polygramma]